MINSLNCSSSIKVMFLDTMVHALGWGGVCNTVGACVMWGRQIILVNLERTLVHWTKFPPIFPQFCPPPPFSLGGALSAVQLFGRLAAVMSPY